MPSPFDRAGMAEIRAAIEKLKPRPQKRSPSRSDAIGGAVEALAAVAEEAIERAANPPPARRTILVLAPKEVEQPPPAAGVGWWNSGPRQQTRRHYVASSSSVRAAFRPLRKLAQCGGGELQFTDCGPGTLQCEPCQPARCGRLGFR